MNRADRVTISLLIDVPVDVKVSVAQRSRAVAD